MLNSSEFIKNLEKIMEYYHINASVLADKIGIQRSGLSHILSGRNKPSLEFILKIISEFPEVDFYWLTLGKGTFPKSNYATPPTLKKSSDQEENKISIKTENNLISSVENSSEIERIVFFYKNGSFKEYSNP